MNLTQDKARKQNSAAYAAQKPASSEQKPKKDIFMKKVLCFIESSVQKMLFYVKSSV